MRWSPDRLPAAAGALLVGAALLLPLAALFTAPGAGWTVRLAAIGLVGLTAVRPSAGLAAFVLLLPLSSPLGTETISRASVSDVLLVAFAIGGAVRLSGRRDEPTRLAGPALVLITAVATSTVVELHQMHLVVPRQSFWPGVLRHVTHEFWIDTRSFVVVHDAVRWIAGLVAAVLVERIVRAAPAARDRIVGAWLVGGAVAGVLTLAFVLYIVDATNSWSPVELATIVVMARWSALQPDLNAAGSYFALFLLPAALLAWRQRARWVTFVVLPLVAYGFWAAQSRAAIAAAVLVLSIDLSLRLLRSRNARVAAIAVGAGGLVLVVLLAVMARTHVGLGAATRVRLDLLTVGLETVERFPVFGVGLGDYIRMTRRYITTDTLALLQFAPQGENSHNNFLQIAVELGLPACLVFVWMTAGTVLAAWRRPSDAAVAASRGMALGLAAFLLSALFGHPLLQPQVFAPLFVALGLTAGLSRAPEPAGPTARMLVHAAALFYVVALPWRLG